MVWCGYVVWICRALPAARSPLPAKPQAGYVFLDNGRWSFISQMKSGKLLHRSLPSTRVV